LSGVAMYTEVQVMDERRRAIVIANSGEGEDGVRDPRAKSSIIGNANFRGTHGRGASFAYPLKPGAATLLSFTPTPKNARPYRLIAAEGAILRDRIPDAGALAGFFRFANVDLHTGYRRWLEAGAVHHAATTHGHWAREIADVAQLLDIEVVNVTTL
jgi:L-arabinose isomerase